MPLSQSPDSVMAFSAGASAIEAEGESVSETPMCDGIGILTQSSLPTSSQRPATSSSSSSSSLNPGISSATLFETKTKQANRMVVNPYIKASTSAFVVDPRLRKRRQFVDKYRVLSLQQVGNDGRHHYAEQHSISYQVGPMVVASPISAWNIHCETQQWRHLWQYPELEKCKKNPDVISDMPLRPRLFLIHSRNGAHNADLSRQEQSSKHQQWSTERPTSKSSQRRHHHDEGIWELGNGITELSGEGGSGKTQICLSLCVTCVMTPPLYQFGTESNQHASGTNQYYSALYISMGEGIRSTTIARRLEQMVQSRLERTYPNKYVEQFLSRIGLISLRNEEEFLDFVDHDLPSILEHKHHQHQRHRHYQRLQSQTISLLILDGIAGFFRFSDPLFQQFQKSNSTFHRQRGSRLLHISSQLRKLSDLHNIPILITNQVTASIPSSDTASLSTSPGGDLPALGLVWSNCVSTRYTLQRKDQLMAVTVSDKECKDQNNSIVGKRVRVARILQSVNMPKDREVRFVIETGGVVVVS
jgi:RecA/RadA recombinase